MVFSDAIQELGHPLSRSILGPRKDQCNAHREAGGCELDRRVWATERFRTKKRNEASADQENATRAALAKAGMTFAAKAKGLQLMPGQFMNATSWGGKRCDVLAKLADQRWLAIECKVSNSSANSFKRLNNDTVAKAKAWQQAYGDLGLVVCAVLDGVFLPNNVIEAQVKYGIFVVWAHDLSVLEDFVGMAKP